MSSELGRRLHIVLSSQADPSRPTRLTLAMGPGVDQLWPVEWTDDPAEVAAVLRVLADGGEAPHPRMEREWGPQLRESHARRAAAARVGTGPLGQRLHG